MINVTEDFVDGNIWNVGVGSKQSCVDSIFFYFRRNRYFDLGYDPMIFRLVSNWSSKWFRIFVNSDFNSIWILYRFELCMDFNLNSIWSWIQLGLKFRLDLNLIWTSIPFRLNFHSNLKYIRILTSAIIRFWFNFSLYSHSVWTSFHLDIDMTWTSIQLLSPIPLDSDFN